jgi:hypothetical protein
VVRVSMKGCTMRHDMGGGEGDEGKRKKAVAVRGGESRGGGGARGAWEETT